MHGLIFSSLRDYTAIRLGETRAVELWADRIFETTQAYDDRWFAAQLERLATASGDSMDEVQRGFGSFAAQSTFAGLYPAYYEESGDTFTFLLGIEEKIHELVRATIPGAYPPKLHVQTLNGPASSSPTRRSGGCAAYSKGSSAAPPSTTARLSSSRRSSACARATPAASSP